MRDNSIFKRLLIYAVVIGVIIAVIVMLVGGMGEDEKTTADLLQMFKDDNVKEFVMDNYSDELTVKTKDGKTYTFTCTESFFNDQIYEKYKDKIGSQEGQIEFNFKEPTTVPWWISMLPTVIMLGMGIALFVYVKRQASGKGGAASFGKSKARTAGENGEKVLFTDVAGADEEKEELEEIVEFLKNPGRYEKLGAKIPHGVLLVGPPGTGKTLLAKAVAGEADVPFYSISGSDFVEMFVGVGASRVRDLFETARKNKASIIFIDEIDAVGRRRGTGLGGGHDEREQTLNQLLVEMDGFVGCEGTIVIAATNRPDVLDPALLRPGRFDRQVTVNYPDIRGREAILKVHCRKKALEQSVDLKKIAQMTVGFTGADLANLMNEAALLAARKAKSLIGMNDIEESYMKLLLGPQKRNKVRTERDIKLVAYHETGHAIACYCCPSTDPVKHITTIPAGNTGGVTLMVPEHDRLGQTKGQMVDHIVVALGGRVAEMLVMDDISTGASNDIQQATAVARDMVTRYGMSKNLGTVLYGSEHTNDEVFLGRDFSTGKNFSEKTAAAIDDEIRAIIDDAYARCTEYLQSNIEKLHFVAGFLMKYETMDEFQFKAAMERDDITYEELDAMVAEKRRISEEENAAKRARDEEEKKKKSKRHDERDKDYREQLRRDFKAEMKDDAVAPAAQEKNEGAPTDEDDYRERLRREFGNKDDEE
ncbi:MAG: ATP-dependent zinc metalloprotease FtsH [Ruminococcaceae bacterium]|nr:ATP-dependent zinc metalloprotease FtsH [Oscillospiraceae bacterium]